MKDWPVAISLLLGVTVGDGGVELSETTSLALHVGSRSDRARRSGVGVHVSGVSVVARGAKIGRVNSNLKVVDDG